MSDMHPLQTTAQPSPAGRGRAWRIGLCLCAALACSDGKAAVRRAAVEEAERLLATDASAALHAAKAALVEHASDPSLSLLAARACMVLDRHNEALEFAEQALDTDDLEQDVKAELNWVRGGALMGRFRDLGSDVDWRAANAALEAGTVAGGHRVEAAALLVFLQDLSHLGSETRRARFAAMVERLDQDGDVAEKVRAYLDAQAR